MSLSVLIPWRETSDDRRVIFEWTVARCQALLPGASITIGDSCHEPFNRGASINRAAAESKGDCLLILDADTFFHAEQISTAIQYIEHHDTWVLPYDVYVNLDDATTKRLLDSAPTVVVDPATVGADFWLHDSVSGLIVLSRDGFEQTGGFDEHFRGWGYEDRAFESAANTLLNPCRRVEGYCYHLAHTPSDRFEQIDIGFNRARAETYRRLVGYPARMRQLVGQ